MKKKLNCILLIDDDEPTNFINRIVIEQSLCADHVEVAQTGEQALSYLTNNTGLNSKINYPRPDLIFLDINMPAMNGWEFLEKYRKLQKEQQGKIVMVMLTTSPNADDELRAKQIPEISGFENKPLTAVILKKIFAKHFSDNFK